MSVQISISKVRTNGSILFSVNGDNNLYTFEDLRTKLGDLTSSQLATLKVWCNYQLRVVKESDGKVVTAGVQKNGDCAATWTVDSDGKVGKVTEPGEGITIVFGESFMEWKHRVQRHFKEVLIEYWAWEHFNQDVLNL